MDKIDYHQPDRSVSSADRDPGSLGARLWQSAYEERNLLLEGTAVALSLFLNRGRIIRTGINFAAELVPLERMPSVAKASGGLEASFAHLVEAMRTNGITTADLAASVKSTQRIGFGTKNEVFSINNLPEYVLRKPFNAPSTASKDLIEIRDIMPGTNVGQVLAETGTLQVLRRQPGEALKFPPFLGEYERSWDLRRQTRMLAKLPQESFDNLAQTLKKMNDRNLFFDGHGGNVVLDKSTLRLGPIDLVARSTPEMINSRRQLEDTFFLHNEARVWPYYERVKNMIDLASSRAGLP